jgi:hypothetical protein
MIIGIDETGAFSINKHKKFGLITLVSATDTEWNNFQLFLNSKLPHAFRNIKGSSITFANREMILKYIGKHPEIKYTTFLYDLTFGSDNQVQEHKTKQMLKIHEWNLDNLSIAHPKLIDELELLRRHIYNLSNDDYAKYFFITETLIEWKQYFLFDYMRTHFSRDNWKMKFVIDTQNKPEKFKGLIKKTMQLTTNSLSSKVRIYIPDEWSNNHPFLENYSALGNINLQDGRKFFEDFSIGNEQMNNILFLPDLIGNTVYNSILNSNDTKWLRILARIKQNRSMTMIRNGKKDYYYLILGFAGNNMPIHTDISITKHFINMKRY